MMSDDACPCGSGLAYATCCQPLHAGGIAVTAEQMMRSRYCAFVWRNLPYLVRTSHPTIRAALKPRDLQATFDLGWRGLEVVATVAGGPDDREGTVHFRASHLRGVHEERSRFTRRDGEWLYRDSRG